MTGVKVIHHWNNKRNNSQQHPEIKWLLENCICLVLPKVKGQCQTIILRKILQRKMDFLQKECQKKIRSHSQKGVIMFCQTRIQSPQLKYIF